MDKIKDRNTPSSETVTDFIGFSPIDGIDYTLGFVYTVFFLVGLPANCLSLRYFTSRKNKDSTIWIYLGNSITNLIFCVLSICCGLSFFRGRKPLAFANTYFCGIWAYIFTITQKIMIVLIGVLSASRAFVLFFPLKSIDSRLLLIPSTVIVSVMIYELVLVTNKFQNIVYLKADVHCYFEINKKHDLEKIFHLVDNVLFCVIMLFPFMVSFFSCIFSIIQIAKAPSQKRSRTTIKYQRRASKTVILLTIIFLLCFLPTYANYILWTVCSVRYPSYPYPPYRNTAMYWYSWNMADVFSISLYSTITPILLIVRLQKFRLWVNRFTREATITHSVFSRNTTIRRDIEREGETTEVVEDRKPRQKSYEVDKTDKEEDNKQNFTMYEGNEVTMVNNMVFVNFYNGKSC